jgi:hypothetical protein
MLPHADEATFGSAHALRFARRDADDDGATGAAMSLDERSQGG